MPHSIPHGLTKDHILLAIADLELKIEHPFGKATGYELVYNSTGYAPKAVIGLAYLHLAGRVLGPEEFSGGEAPGQANFVLRKLGFTVVRRGETEANEEVASASREWSVDEVRVIVADYFDMLRAELLSQPYSKTEHRNRIAPRLSARSKGSIEFKHANISAVLVERGLPYITGYKPRGNYQSLLATEVEAFLEQESGVVSSLATALDVPPQTTPTLPRQISDLFEDPPEAVPTLARQSKPWVTRKVRKVDFLEREKANRRLAELGERFVLDVERQRLIAAGRDDLALKVDWVATTIGDGLGFDILSYDELDESELFVEVKTTGQGKFFPFYVTRNEVNCSVDVPEKYHLYRVFEFKRAPRLYVLHGSLKELCVLEPTQFSGTVR